VGVFKKGNTYYIDYYVNGRRKREAIGESRELAKTVLAKRKLEIAEGKFLDIKKKPKISFSELAQKFLDYSKVNRSPGTYQYHYFNLKPILDFFSGSLIAEIGINEVERYKAKRIREVTAVTLNHELSVLKNVFNRAVEWGILGENPVVLIKKVPEKGSRLRYLSFDEIKRLLASCKGILFVIVSIALNTGMRKSEILNLKWQDIDFENLIIRLDVTKSGKRRDIPIRSDLATIIQSLPKINEYLFPNHDKHLKSVKKAFRTATIKAGIDDFRFHDLRHTFASQLVMSGIDLATVKELMGHSTIEMTMRYAHLSPDHRRAAIELLGSKIGHILDT